MIYKEMALEIDYQKAGVQPGQNPASLTAYVLEKSEELKMSPNRMAVIICPGGAYRFRSDRESEPVAMRFLAAGVQAFVLQYSVAPSRYPCAFLELGAAVSMVRDHAREWGIDQERVMLCGFSAGGHLCATFGTLWRDELISRSLGRDSQDYKPAGMILCYPVITMGDFTHQESRRLLLGGNPSKEEKDKVSLEKQVSSDTIPAFLWHTCEDDTVPAENSLLFACALRKYGVPFELHIYERGKHGLSLCDETTAREEEDIQPDNAGWFPLALQWMKRQKI